jgi:hypothetical protein
VGQLSDALTLAGHQLEARLRTHGDRMMREGLGTALPQSWRFQTESETAVLRLDGDLRVTAGDDVVEPPAVIVQSSREALVGALLSGRSNERARATPPMFRFTSDAGRKAFSMLGTSFGL